MGYNTIHETVVTDVLDSIKTGVQWVDGKLKPKSPKIRTAGSIARATSGLTLTFPVICSDTFDLETATMISKAIERKNIALLQMAFSAYNITNATDAISHLSKFHTNMDVDKMNLDKFMDIMESIDEAASTMVLPSEMKMIAEDCKRNCNLTMEPSVNYKSLMEFYQVKRYGQSMIVQEDVPNYTLNNGYNYTDDDMYKHFERTHGFDPADTKYIDTWEKEKHDRDMSDLDFGHSKDLEDIKYQNSKGLEDIRHQNSRDIENIKNQNSRDLEDIKNRHATERDAASRQHSRDMEDIKHQNSKELEDIKNKNATDRDRAKRDFDAAQNDIRNKQSASNDKRQYFATQLLPTDVKKANEMQPSLMIVNFYVNDRDRDLNIAQQVVAGVKSKLYPVTSSDIMNKIITKTVDSDVILKLVKVSTREISFVRDFLLGLDDAKLDALSKSRKGSGSAMFRALERRAIKGKIRKNLKLENSAKAISTIAITVEEAEELKKYNNIDVMNPRIISKFMEKMNLLYFVVVDTTSEAVHIFTDGDSQYESLSFSALERESGDGAYKKVVKLMTSVAN